ncbi:Ribosomal RNA small subunit methyltransferase G [Candidatus Tremblaya princeps]|uniref:Ribosomal RNA small subunit methyltransferase G n=1 Tax=Tremblaya princeps TaxID=189385 RepID=A0A143WNQ7_TREPR|nr:Ribosomal RNA small subunit methyltransferase G [Candidatus Tremblaya princeps]
MDVLRQRQPTVTPGDVAEHARRCTRAMGALLSIPAARAVASLSRSMARWSATHGLTGRGCQPSLAPHVCDAAAIGAVVARLVRPAQHTQGATVTVVDVGSGAGLPGMALGAMMPGLRVISLEAALAKSVFQSYIQRKLGLRNLKVLRPSDAYCSAIGADVVIARALAPYRHLLRRLCRHGWAGAVLTASGYIDSAAIAQAASGCGYRAACALRLKVPMVSKRRYVVITGAAYNGATPLAMPAGAL